MTARRLGVHDMTDMQLALELTKREFAYMDGVVDPASSINRLTLEDLASGPGEVWVIGSPPVASVVFTPKAEVLYIGKLAVDAGEQRKGLARSLFDQAEVRAVELGLSWLELQTRVELESNHRTFAALGFVETGRTAHAGYARPTSITYRRPVPWARTDNPG